MAAPPPLDADPGLPRRLLQHFLQHFSRTAIDAGADLFTASGIDHPGPTEIYRGRPLSYRRDNFFWRNPQVLLAQPAGTAAGRILPPEQAAAQRRSAIRSGRRWPISASCPSAVLRQRGNILLAAAGEPLRR